MVLNKFMQSVVKLVDMYSHIFRENTMFTW